MAAQATEAYEDPLSRNEGSSGQKIEHPNTSGDPIASSSPNPGQGLKSSYYVGPPGKGSVFGTPPVGVIGRDKPRDIIRCVCCTIMPSD